MGPVPQANHGKHFSNKMRGLETLQKEIALDLRIHVCVWPFFLHMSRTHDTSAVMAYAKFRFDYFCTVEVTLNTKKIISVKLSQIMAVPVAICDLR